MPVDPKTLYKESEVTEIERRIYNVLRTYGVKSYKPDRATLDWKPFYMSYAGDFGQGSANGDITVQLQGEIVFARQGGTQLTYRPGKWVGKLDSIGAEIENARAERKRLEEEEHDNKIKALFEPIDDSSYFKD